MKKVSDFNGSTGKGDGETGEKPGRRNRDGGNII